jgi:hypothetical protein
MVKLIYERISGHINMDNVSKYYIIDPNIMDDESGEYYYYMLIDLAYGNRTFPIKKRTLGIKIHPKIKYKYWYRMVTKKVSPVFVKGYLNAFKIPGEKWWYIMK